MHGPLGAPPSKLLLVENFRSIRVPSIVSHVSRREIDRVPAIHGAHQLSLPVLETDAAGREVN